MFNYFIKPQSRLVRHVIPQESFFEQWMRLRLSSVLQRHDKIPITSGLQNDTFTLPPFTEFLHCFLRKYFILICLLIVSCAQKTADVKTDSKGVVRLTYWCSPNPQEIDLAREQVENWNRLHRDIQVHLQPIPASQSSEEVLLAAIAGKTTPDVCSNMWPGAMDDFIAAGGLVRLDEFPDFAQLMEDRIPAEVIQSFRSVDGHIYQIPWKTNPIMLFYNIGIFEKCGVKSPLRTYSDYLQAAEKIVRDENGDGQVEQWMSYRNIQPIWWQRLFDFFPFYIAASGGKTLFRHGLIDFQNEAAVETFRFFQKVYQQGYFPVTDFQGDAFLAQKLATHIGGPWAVAFFDKFKTPDLRYDIMPLPVPDDYTGPVYSYGDYKNISIFSTTQHPREAWEFARSLVTAHNDLRLLETCSQIPLRKDMTADSLFQDYFQKNPKMAAFAVQAPATRGVDGVADLKEIFDTISQEYEACAIYQKITPEQAVENAVRRAQIIITWNRGK